jgi:hypothetical protein
MEAATLVMALSCLAGALFTVALYVKRRRDDTKRREVK